MQLTRRAALSAGAGAVALAAGPIRAGAAPAATIALYDPALPGAHERAVARGAALALSHELRATWQRSLAAHSGPIAGETRWADLVALRALAAEQRRHLRAETVMPHGGIAWLIA